jgi:integrase
VGFCAAARAASSGCSNRLGPLRARSPTWQGRAARMLEAGAPLPYVMDQVGHADSKTTLEIYAQVQKRVSRKNVHAAFDELLNAADIDSVSRP